MNRLKRPLYLIKSTPKTIFFNFKYLKLMEKSNIW